jgi:hypothetical protein
MKNRIVRTLALGFGLSAILATSALNATTFYSAKVTIPFEFRVGKHMYSAGEYRVEQDFGKDIAYLVNLKTGQRVHMLRPLNDSSVSSNSKLTFETVDGVHILKRMS